MRLTTVILIATMMQVSATTFGQRITLDLKNAPLNKVIKEIRNQSGYDFYYDTQLIKKATPITIQINNASIEEVMKACLDDQPLTYKIENRGVMIKEKEKSFLERVIDKFYAIEVRGTILDNDGNPLAGASIKVKGANLSTISNQKGEFVLVNVDEKAIIEISFIGFKTVSFKATDSFASVKLEKSESKLDEVQIIAYGTTTRRLSTGSIGSIKAEDIEKQPVANPLLALEGRIAGLVVSPTKGLPGAAVKVQIRGQNSIAQGSDPLFIIDGVPFAPNNSAINLLNSALSQATTDAGVSPFSIINPSDIESIDVLKDADALAIYGSRGANGVILISTKKGKSGQVKLTANAYAGISYANKMARMMNTQEYVQMRKEAFKNDGVTPTISNGYDLLVFDTTRFTDLRKLLIKPASTNDAQLRASGGNEQTQFALGGSYHRETTVYAGNTSDNRMSLNSSLTHRSTDNKLNISASMLYSYDKNSLIFNDLASIVINPPNLPELTDGSGNLIWQKDGVNFTNPLSYQRKTYVANTENLISNLVLSYKIFKEVTARVSAGYNSLNLAERNINPIAAQNPDFSPTGTSSQGNNAFRSWIVEPQLDYTKKFSTSKLNILLGATWQEQLNHGAITAGSGYNTDALLGSITAAATITASNTASKYHYQAIFGRINYNISDRYILNITGRRDGSSRFGPGRQFGNFAAVGGAWLFSNEPFFPKNKVISFGKLRASYGTTGNDQIGDYNYLDLWTNNRQSYNGSPGLYPVQHFNPDYEWEINRKIDIALELGLIDNRVFFTGSIYRNRSSNQLLSYAVPAQTGFVSIPAKNFPAVIENRGIEITLETKNIAGADFKWSTNFNISMPRNRLVSFPGLATSSYASSLKEGESLNLIKAYRYLGLNPATGAYNVDKSELVVIGDRDPKYLGGINNTVSYKGFQVDFFVEGRRQKGFNYLRNIYQSFFPGYMYNQPAILAARWRQTGDPGPFQKVTMTFGSIAQAAMSGFASSDASVSDVSFLRLKTASLSYTLAEKTIRKLHLGSMRVFVTGQNLLTVSNYKEADPQSLNIYALPTLQTFVGGFQITF